MLFDSKKKNMGAAILGNVIDGKISDGDPDGDIDDPDAHLHAIAGELIDAVHGRDHKGVVSAMRAMHACLGGEVSGDGY